MSTKGQMRLGAFFNPTGHHVASWRHPRAQADAGINFQHYLEITRTAERGKFDMVFLADNLGVRQAHMEALSRSAQYIANFEPITLLSALATHTSHIGLVATASTSYNEPFHVARKFASLDHLSGGRAGWNLVTSGQENEARNFSREKHYEHGERYDRAREFAQVVLGTMGQLGRRRVRPQQGDRAVFPSRQAAQPQSSRQAFLGARRAQYSAQPARPSGDRAGRRLRRHDRRRRGIRRSDFLRAADARSGAEVLCDAEGQLAAFGRAPDEMKIMPGLSPPSSAAPTPRPRKTTSSLIRSFTRSSPGKSSPWCSATSI